MHTARFLRKRLRAHLDAEFNHDVASILDTVSDDIEYHIIGPRYTEDTHRFGVAAKGREGLRELWEGYFRRFSNYKAIVRDEDMLVFSERNLVVALVDITATLAEDFEGFSAGRPFSDRTAALCEFDATGDMVRETIYGSIGQFVLSLSRMRAFLSEEPSVRLYAQPPDNLSTTAVDADGER